MTQPNTPSGRSPDEALERIAGSLTCPVCKGEKALRGYRCPDDSLAIYPGQKQVTILCDECGGAGTVPAAGDLAQWLEEVRALLWNYERNLAGSLPRLRNHLAAMPAQDVNTALLAALKKIERECSIEYWRDVARAAIAQAEQGAAG